MSGGKVLIQTPVYSEFYDVVEAWGHTVVENKLVESDGRWHIDFDDFAAKAKECDVFLLCNPHNPLGIVWAPEELTKMAEICMEHNTLLVSDEIHSDLIFHGKRHTPTASLSPEITAGVITCISATLRRSTSSPSTTPRVRRSMAMIHPTRMTMMTASTSRPMATSANGERLSEDRNEDTDAPLYGMTNLRKS